MRIRVKLPRLQVIVYGALIAVILGIGWLFVARQFSPQPAHSVSKLPVYGQVPTFRLTNQLHQTFTLDHLQGSVWVADIIFTRCPSSCLKMSDSMRRLTETIPPSAPVRFVSLTADPQFDTPAVLLEYSRRQKADPSRWSFLTGTKAEIYGLAVKGLKLVVVDKSQQPLQEGEELFLHSATFVLVDSRGYIRAYYDTSEPGAFEKIVADIETLTRRR